MMMQKQYVNFQLKTADSGGAFAGHCAVFNNIDLGNDIIAPGAFSKCLAQIKASNSILPILWQHQTDTPIGAWTKLEEDDAGLYGEGMLWLDESPQAKIAYKGLTSRAVNGLSIGYTAQNQTYDKTTDIRTLNEVKIGEISIVTFPMNPQARVDSVKSALRRGDFPTLLEFEKFLRESGFSEEQAAGIARKGMPSRTTIETFTADDAFLLLKLFSP